MKPSTKVPCFPIERHTYMAERYDLEERLPEGCELIIEGTEIHANCSQCKRPYGEHAYCEGLSPDRKLVCPGNIIVTTPKGGKVQITPVNFKLTYAVIQKL